MRQAVVASLALSFISVAACGKKDSKKTILVPADPITANLSDKIQGTWQGTCVAETTTGSMDKLVFANGTETETLTSFSAKDCAAGSELARTEVASTYTIPGGVNPGKNADFVSQSITNVSLTPLTAAFILGANSAKICGHSDWELNKPQSGSAAACGLSAGNGKAFGLFLTAEGNTLTSYNEDGSVSQKYSKVN